MVHGLAHHASGSSAALKRPRASRVSVVRSRMERGDIVALPAGDLVKPLERRFSLFYVKKIFAVSLFCEGCLFERTVLFGASI